MTLDIYRKLFKLLSEQQCWRYRRFHGKKSVELKFLHKSTRHFYGETRFKNLSILNGAISNNVNTFPLNEKKCQHLKNNLKFYNITIYTYIYPWSEKHHSTKLGGKYWKCFLPFKWMGWWIWGLKEQLANLLDTKICIFEMEKYLLTP